MSSSSKIYALMDMRRRSLATKVRMRVRKDQGREPKTHSAGRLSRPFRWWTVLRTLDEIACNARILLHLTLSADFVSELALPGLTMI